MKKYLSLILCIAVILTLMAPVFAEEKPTLTIWVPNDMRISDWEDNLMTKWLEEQLGANLDFIIQPSADYNAKVNLALTAGDVSDLPDIIMGGVTNANIGNWAEFGTILPLKEYYDDPELAENINDAIERCGFDFTKHLSTHDDIYSIGYLNQSYGNEYPHKLWIYKPWLDALGMEIPETTEDFYEVLKAVKETDLNGNGKPDEIGMVGSSFTQEYNGWFSVLMNAFAYAGNASWLEFNGDIATAAYTSDAWREGLAYIKQMMDEGLVIPESLTMGKAEVEQLMNTEDITVFAFAYYSPQMITDMERRAEYICIEPLTGPEGINYATYRPSVANPAMVITVACEEPELAFKLGDLMTSEYIGISTRFGAEGIDWDYADKIADPSAYKASVDGFELSIICYNDAAFWGGSDQTANCWRQRGPYVRDYSIANGLATSIDKVDVITSNFNTACTIYQKGGFAPENVLPLMLVTIDDCEKMDGTMVDFTTVANNCITWARQCSAAFLADTMDLDSGWDAYVAEYEQLGIEDYLYALQNMWDRLYKD